MPINSDYIDYLGSMFNTPKFVCTGTVEPKKPNHRIKVVMATEKNDIKAEVSTGVIRSMPDLRDYSDRHNRIAPILSCIKTNVPLEHEHGKAKTFEQITAEDLPKVCDLVEWFSDVETQGAYGSCTAQAGVGLLEYMQRRAYGENVELSRMFLYNCTKRLLGWTGDTGAYLRTTMAAIRIFGVPPEKHFGYEGKNLDVEPDGYVFSMAGNFKGISYFRHDAGENTEPACALLSIKKNLAAGIPSMFGFYGFDSFNDAENHGEVPMPGPSESAKWAHAVCAAGYNDDYEITNTRTNTTTKGAILFRNSWGKSWGNDGYGYISYDYFLRRYCWDMWSILNAEWVETGEFGL